MAQNITLMGASYSDVPAVTLPKTGGGIAQFDDTTDATATASDIISGKTAYVNGQKITGTGSGGGGITVSPLSVTANGTYTAPSGTAYSPVTVNVSGGGGASNVVTGTFTGTTTGAAMNVPLNYSGNGYPVAIAIYPKAGYQTGSPAYDLLQRYAVMHFSGVKRQTSAPTYESSGSPNQFCVYATYKSSSSTADTLGSGGSANRVLLRGSSASSPSNAYDAIKFINAKTMSVFIASTNYGFAANIEYTYYVIYSE